MYARHVMLSAATLLALSGQAIASMPINGKAHLSAPLVGSTLSIYDQTGKLVETLPRATDGEGRIQAKLKAPLRHFTLVLTGGSHEGVPFRGELRSDVAAYRPGVDQVYVNAATTIVSRYHSVHPHLTVGESTASVRNYLGIPTSFDLGKGLSKPGAEEHFSHSEFLAKARLSGGLNAYTSLLAKSVDQYSHAPSFGHHS